NDEASATVVTRPHGGPNALGWVAREERPARSDAKGGGSGIFASKVPRWNGRQVRRRRRKNAAVGVSQSCLRAAPHLAALRGGSANLRRSALYTENLKDAKRWRADGLTFFHSAATCLHVPARLTRESTKREGRKPRTSERHVVGCCEQLGGRLGA